MERTEARQVIRENWRTILQSELDRAKTKANGETSYICPFCGHGAHGDGLTFDPNSPNGATLHCFGCGFSGDVISLYEKMHNFSFIEAENNLAAILGLTIEDSGKATSPRKIAHSSTKTKNDKLPRLAAKSPDYPQNGGKDAVKDEKSSAADYTAYFLECELRLFESPEARNYIEKRGIGEATARRCHIGYDPAADPASAPGATAGSMAEKKHPQKRIIIPTSKSHYIARSIESETEKRYQKLNPTGGTPAIFMMSELETAGSTPPTPVFVTEGAFDAMAVIEAGQKAVALNSTSNRQLLIDTLQEMRAAGKRVPPLIICLDSDEPGQRAAAELLQQLHGGKFLAVAANISCGYKDPNEALTQNRAEFLAATMAAVDSLEAVKRPDTVQAYILGGGFETARAGAARRVKTGFANFDKKTGGLYPGLYVLGAISSLGKTTFATQMAEQIAAGGTDVLFFSMEQSRLEIVSKGLARCLRRQYPSEAITSLEIRDNRASTSHLQDVIRSFSNTVGPKMSIIEGNFDTTIENIGEYIDKYILFTGTSPVVFVDYLQVIQTAAQYGHSRKDEIDQVVTALKRKSREHNITIFVISSVNRSNYHMPVAFESFKESGGIEYTADVVLGLQLRCISEQGFSSKNDMEKRKIVANEKAKNERALDLVCLKNRFGVSSFRLCFNYTPAFETFIAVNEQPQQATTRI